MPSVLPKTTVRLEEDVRKILEEEAERLGTSSNKVIGRIVREWVNLKEQCREQEMDIISLQAHKRKNERMQQMLRTVITDLGFEHVKVIDQG